MHEMGIVASILEAATEAAEEAGATKITEIHISVGDLTEIVDFALDFAFDALTPGTIAEGGKLVVTHIPPKSRCGECGAEFEHGRFEVTCPECGSFLATPLQGRELRIDNIEIETPDEEPAVESSARTSGGKETGPASGDETS